MRNKPFRPNKWSASLSSLYLVMYRLVIQYHPIGQASNVKLALLAIPLTSIAFLLTAVCREPGMVWGCRMLQALCRYLNSFQIDVVLPFCTCWQVETLLQFDSGGKFSMVLDSVSCRHPFRRFLTYKTLLSSELRAFKSGLKAWCMSLGLPACCANVLMGAYRCYNHSNGHIRLS